MVYMIASRINAERVYGNARNERVLAAQERDLAAAETDWFKLRVDNPMDWDYRGGTRNCWLSGDAPSLDDIRVGNPGQTRENERGSW